MVYGTLEGPSRAAKSCQGLFNAWAEMHPRKNMLPPRNGRKRSVTASLHGIRQKH